ncbi:hypothetical protein TSOC_010264 [Tetrabaena socialis]|uniref:Uncharacterized protein n=1 Tax=Tetrabaena socialis TaxID=47790 RepID=A0A2J7ZTQ0_9CHLO|nr:hypothetical protein TSOC_010264 [Tetrabaena socialis]|eukprot:PNH03653.1 hypothetical protein TSOC_010264 [Tetrabaena socialis]
MAATDGAAVINPARLSGSKRPMAPRIGTHSGTFHCDEALGCWLLKQTAQFRDADIVRTRDPELLKELDIIIDVGGVHPSGKIMLLKDYCPWKDHLYDLEKEGGFVGELLFCVYQDDRDKSYRVQAVSVGPGSFENRRSLPAAWRGVRDDSLAELAGIPGCVFVHAGGFIGGNKTEEGALEMAKRALEMD